MSQKLYFFVSSPVVNREVEDGPLRKFDADLVQIWMSRRTDLQQLPPSTQEAAFECQRREEPVGRLTLDKECECIATTSIEEYGRLMWEFQQDYPEALIVYYGNDLDQRTCVRDYLSADDFVQLIK